MRILILAALAAGALLAWLNVRDLIGLLRRPSEGASTPEQPDPMDAVQPADPWPPEVRVTSLRISSVEPGSTWSASDERVPPYVSDNLAPALDPDPPYLEAMPLAHMRRAFSTQSGPLGPTA